jgi:hypothetical protein
VPEIHFVNAVTWGGAIFQLANITGPALGGLLFTLPLTGICGRIRGLRARGLCMCSRWDAGVVSGAGGQSLHVRPGRMEHRDLSLKVVLAGFQYVRRARMLLGSFSLDLFVVLLGGAVALMPIFAHEILHQGPRGLGMLRAAPAVGAVAMSLTMARFPLHRRAGAGCLSAWRSSGLRRWSSGCRTRCGSRWLRWRWRARQIPSA